MENINDNKYVYRFMSIQKAMDIFENKWLVLVKPSAWSDAFENYISKVKYKKGDKIYHVEYLNNIYGICLTLGKESNLMWDAYTPFRNGVRLQFNLLNLINELNKNLSPHKFHSKPVRYVRYKDFISRLDNKSQLIRLFENQNSGILKNLFEKRYEYRFEEEYRILYDANETKYVGKETIQIPIDPLKVIEGIRFDPKMPDNECNALKKYFLKQGLDGRKIKRSLLYKFEIKKEIEL